MIISVVMAVLDLRALAGMSARVPKAAIWQSPVKTGEQRKPTQGPAISTPSGYAFALGPLADPEAGVWQGWPREWLISLPKHQCTFGAGLAIEAFGKRFQPKITRTYTFCREYLALFVLTLRFQKLPYSLPRVAFEDFLRRLLNAPATFRVRGKPLVSALGTSHANLTSLHRAALPQKRPITGSDQALLKGVSPLLFVKDTEGVLAAVHNPALTKAWKVGCSAARVEIDGGSVPIFVIRSASATSMEGDGKLFQNMSRMQSYICGNWFEGVAMHEMVNLIDQKKNLARREVDRQRLTRFLARSAGARRMVRRQLRSEDAKLIEDQTTSGTGVALDARFQAARQLVKTYPNFREHMRDFLEAMRGT